MQCRGDSNKIQHGYIPFSAFDTPKVGTVHPNLSGKSFLRVALAAAQLAYLSADCNQLGVLWHIGKVRDMLCIGPRFMSTILREWVWGKRPIDLIDHISQIALVFRSRSPISVLRRRQKQHPLYIARPRLVRFGHKMRTFTPRRLVHPTDSDDHFVPGIHAKLVNAH